MNDNEKVPCPAHVRGCTIRNDSDGDVRARIIHQTKSDQETNNDEFVEIDLAQGQTYRVQEKLVAYCTCAVAQPIETIEVVRNDGRIIRATAPFEGVKSVVHDWLFIVKNDTIQSIQKNG